MGAVHNAPDCQTGRDDDCPAVPVLSPTSPSTRSSPRSRKSLSSGALVGIIIGCICLLILLVLILCSISWIKQIWCFKDYKVKKKAEEDAKREEFKSKIKSMTTPGGPGGKSATAAAAKSLQFNQTKQKTELELSNPADPVGSSPFSSSAHTADLTCVPLDPSEGQLPDGWQKMKHNVTGAILYVNNDQMISQKLRPGLSDVVENEW
jgi:hypothetical protein